MKGTPMHEETAPQPHPAENRPERPLTAPQAARATQVPGDPVSLERIGKSAGFRGIEDGVLVTCDICGGEGGDGTGGNCRGCAGLGVVGIAPPIADVTPPVSHEALNRELAADDQIELDVLLARLARVEAAAEVLIVARSDLMREVDRWTGLCRESEIGSDDLEEVARLLDRLAAYMRGQDDRVVALGDQLEQRGVELSGALARIEQLTADLGVAKVAAREAGALVRESIPHVRFVDMVATMTDLEADLDAGELRDAARSISDVSTFPRLYGEEDRGRAIGAVEREVVRQLGAIPADDRDAVGQLVDAVAEALGMRRAGA
jgi:hypothetical protein